MPLKEEFRIQGNFLFKHRSYLPLIILIVGLLVYIFTIKESTTTLEKFTSNYFEIIFLFVSLFGLLIRAYSVGFAAKNTSGRNTLVGQVADSINSTGIYSIVRHPLYIGNFFMWLGIALFTMNFWFVVAFTFLYWLYYERIMYAEEEFLRDKYGIEYITWAERTPAITPDFSKWKSPSGTFSFWKVIKQEKSGVLNLFLAIFLFKVITGYIVFDNFSVADTFWTWALVASVIYYSVIKIVQKSGKYK